jgi:hypothetical protein
LTAEELELIRSVEAGDNASTSNSEVDDEEPGCNLEYQDIKGDFIQANGSSYHALAFAHVTGCVGMGISRAFHSTRECKSRHAVLLLSGGRFAACIFGPDGRVEAHKVCRRYVVRGKQGRAQSSHDNGNGKAKSVGASMRREGEMKLAEDVRQLMLSWVGLLQSCDVIFVSCPAAKRNILFGDYLESKDPRVRRIPFGRVGKPSLEACTMAHSLVCSVLFFHSWPKGVSVGKLHYLPDPRVKCTNEHGEKPDLMPVSPLRVPGLDKRETGHSDCTCGFLDVMEEVASKEAPNPSLAANDNCGEVVDSTSISGKLRCSTTWKSRRRSCRKGLKPRQRSSDHKSSQAAACEARRQQMDLAVLDMLAQQQSRHLQLTTCCQWLGFVVAATIIVSFCPQTSAWGVF